MYIKHAIERTFFEEFFEHRKGGWMSLINDQSVGKVFEVYMKVNEKSALWFEVFAFTEKEMEELVRICLKRHKKTESAEIKLRRINIAPSITSMSLEKTEERNGKLNRSIKKRGGESTTGIIFRGQVFFKDKNDVLSFEILDTNTEDAEKFIKHQVRMRFQRYWPCNDLNFVEIIQSPSILRAKLVGLKINPEIDWEVM